VSSPRGSSPKAAPDKPPTMEDVAAKAGVSRALVSLVMRNSPKVSDGRRKAVLQAADSLGYRPNALARNLASEQTHAIGVVINDLHNPYFVEVLDGMEPVVSRHGYRLLVMPGWQDRHREAAAIETLLEYRVDGIVLAGPQLGPEVIDRTAAVTPVVTVGMSHPTPAFDSVNNNEMVGARLAIDHLTSLGHRSITHVDGGKGAGAAERKAGYLQAMDATGLASHTQVIPGDFTAAAGTQAAVQLIASQQRPTAVFAANDLCAAGILDAFQHAGVRVPCDISVIGYDNTGLAAMPQLSLSTINQPRPEMGALAVEALLDRLQQSRQVARHVVLDPTLVARRTTGPATSPSP